MYYLFETVPHRTIIIKIHTHAHTYVTHLQLFVFYIANLTPFDFYLNKLLR